MFETEAGNHTIIGDVPSTTEWGGRDRAPTPPEFLMMSLSSCVAAFLVKYCNQVGINSDGLSVTVNFSKTDKPVFLKDIKIQTALPNAQIGDHEEALKQVCEHCVVHETMTHIENIDINITTRGTENV